MCDLFSFRFAHEYIAITMQLLGATVVLKNEIRSLLLISNGKAFHRSIVECKKKKGFIFSASVARLVYQRPWYVLSSWLVHIKDPLLVIENSSLCSGGSGFPLFRYLNAPLPYFWTPYNRK